MLKKNIIDKMYSLLFDEIPPTVSEQERAMLIRYRDAYTHWLEDPMSSDLQMRDYLMNAYRISKSQAYRDIVNIKLLLGNVRNAGKEWHRHRVNSLLEKAAQMAIEGDVKEATALAKIAMALIKNNKLDMDEGEELPYDEIVPPAFEPSFIPKSGKKTYGLDSSWAGCAKKVKCGLEICGFAAVDVFKNTAFHLNAIQTPPLKNMSLLEYYCQIIK